MPHPHLRPLSRNPDFYISGFLRNAFKTLYAYPSSHRNTCFKFVSLPLPSSSSFPSISSTGSLGMFILKLVFQDSSSFLSSISKFSVLSEGLPCHLYTQSVCTSVSSASPMRGWSTPKSEALVALTQTRPGCEVLCKLLHAELTMSFSTDLQVPSLF